MDLQSQSKLLSHSISLVYHHLFTYPLDSHELILWSTPVGKYKFIKKVKFEYDRDNYCLRGFKSYVLQKEKRKKISAGKRKIAERAAFLIGRVPTVDFVGITGSLAMNNCKSSSDIDLIIVCKPNTLWSSRVFTLLLLRLRRVGTRKAGIKTQKDLICINMWMESSSMFIEKQDLYTAHELVQIKPLFDKNNIFTKLLKINNWAIDYWPNAYKMQSRRTEEQESLNWAGNLLIFIFTIFNPLMFWMQYVYMKTKITNEQIAYRRAFFHPKDRSEWVEKQLAKHGVVLKNP